MEPFTPALQEYAAELVENGVRSATIAPSALNTPGVLVTVTGFTFDTLTGYTANLELFLVVPDNGPLRSMEALDDLLAEVLAVVQPVDGDVRAVGYVPPVAPGVKPPPPLPALAFNVDLFI